MDSSRGFTMLRCRKCRKNYIDSTCLNLTPSTEERAVAQCSVWHVNVDTLPNGMLAAIHQAQWTVGKLHCGNCSARLGGFNFINHSRCPCGQNITVHLSKSRVDRDPALPGLMQGFPPRGARPAPEEPGFSAAATGGGSSSQGGLEPATATAALRDSPAGPPLQGCDVMSCIPSVTQATPTYAQASSSSSSSSSLRVSDGEGVQTLRHATSKCCVPHRSGRRLQTPHAKAKPPGSSSSSPSASASSSTSSTSSSALYPPGPPERLAAAWAETERSSRPAAALAQRPHLPAIGGPPPPGPASSPPPPPPPPPPPLTTAGPEVARSPPRDRPAEVPGVVVVSAPAEEPQDSPMFLRGRTITDSIGELAAPPPGPQPAPSAVSAALSRLSKREKNRLKSNRRKQRKRERWIHSLLEQEQSLGGLLTDSEEEDREGFTCAVCLDVYYCPYRCHPCGHVFCEPCLRTLARSRPSHTPCPLCRTLISHTLFQKELNETTESFFPKVFNARKNNFQRAPCSRWPLPSGPKRFHIFWGYQRQPAEPGRRWPLGPAGFRLDALDLADMRGWLFDVDLVIIYIHSVNWILAFLLLCFLLYFFFS